MTGLQKRLRKICLLMVKYAISNKKIPTSTIFISDERRSGGTPSNVLSTED